MTRVGEPLRTEQDMAAVLPRWFIRLARRIGKLERGHAYQITVVMVDDEPVWTIARLGDVENDRM